MCIRDRILDAKGRYHRQLCLHGSDPDKCVKIGQFLDIDQGDYICRGVWADEFMYLMREQIHSNIQLYRGSDKQGDSISKFIMKCKTFKHGYGSGLPVDANQPAEGWC